MHLSLVPPRQVAIGDAASFVGTTSEAIRSYHEMGLLPEPEQGGDGPRRYGYESMIRLLWIQKMVDAGIALEDIREVFADTAPAGADSGHNAAVVQRLRTVKGRMGLLSDFVTGRLEGLPEGFLRQTDLDGLLVMERIFGSLGAAMGAGRYLALAAHPGLREESDRVDAAEEALDDTVPVDDPRVAQVAAERHAFERRLSAAIEDSGQAQRDEALLDSWDSLHPAVPGSEGEACQVAGGGDNRVSLSEAIGMMPYDYSPARLRCMELTVELDAKESSAS
ncbi:MerR family transcriptional regulator [Arthrobacter gengyunqii]|uniref:MerR family transcriptional regulator n=1 Tax=Arthrobacter gengyunqii TaxID=2886940 RepID=A0A9X1S9F6_9MICC|nr:MerR family transcriptional regulator [Arthrobacter gengyunqii]MCC3270869.1 MerR family transcriptional regulator [Arthrobacter gengyunqii]UOY96440.1 MerR family transcriptional regulator [Arthrobacter gengyunqii]